MRYRKVNIYIIALLLAFGAWTGSAVAAEYPVDLKGFKCPVAPNENQQIAIFKITRPNGEKFNGSHQTNEDFDYQTHHPKDNRGEFFCVTVAKDKTWAEWTDLINGVNVTGNKIISPEWGDEDVIRQFRMSPGEENGEWIFEGNNSADRGCNSGAYPDNEPDDLVTKYHFAQESAIEGDDELFRTRYWFCELDQNPDEVFVYFMKIAGNNDYPPTNTACQSKYGANVEQCNADAACLWWQTGAKCISKSDNTTKCSELDPNTCTKVLHCKIGDNEKCVDRIVQVNTSEAIDAWISSTHQKPANYNGPLPDCAWDGSCRNVEDLVELGVKVAEWLFSVIAGLAFVFFVYGGITMIMSFGNAEKVGQGKQILVAATLGLIITFSAYILIGFVVKAIGIQSSLLPF